MVCTLQFFNVQGEQKDSYFTGGLWYEKLELDMLIVTASSNPNAPLSKNELQKKKEMDELNESAENKAKEVTSSIIKIWRVDKKNRECIHTFDHSKHRLVSVSLPTQFSKLVQTQRDPQYMNMHHFGSKLLLLSADNFGLINIWNMHAVKGSTVAESRVQHIDLGESSNLTCAMFNLNTILAGCGTHLKLIDTETGKVQTHLHGHKSFISCISFDDTIMLSGSKDKTIKIWDIRTKVCSRTLEGSVKEVSSIQADKWKIVASAQDMVHIWDTRMMRHVETLGESAGRGILGLQFDDSKLVTCTRGGLYPLRIYQRTKMI